MDTANKSTLPCILSLLAAALYNIAGQIFIADANYLGSCVNAANTVFPLTVVGIVMKFFPIIISIVVVMAAGCIPIVGLNMGAEKARRVRDLFTRLLIAEAAVGRALYRQDSQEAPKDPSLASLALPPVNGPQILKHRLF